MLARARFHFCSRLHWFFMRRTGSVLILRRRVSPWLQRTTFIDQIFSALMILGLLAGTQARLRGAPRSDHLSTRIRLLRGSLPATPFLPSRWPDCTLSRLRAEEYDRPVTQSIATPEPSSRTIPTLDRA